MNKTLQFFALVAQFKNDQTESMEGLMVDLTIFLKWP